MSLCVYIVDGVNQMKASKFAAVIGTKGRLTIPKKNREVLAKLLQVYIHDFDGAIVEMEIKNLYIDGTNHDLKSKALISD